MFIKSADTFQNEPSFKIKIHWPLIGNYWESVTNSTATIEVTYKCYSSGVLTPILGLIATIGIIFTITMQSRPKFKDCFLKLLISLACYGSIIITCRVINHTCRIFDAGASIYTDIAQKNHIADSNNFIHEWCCLCTRFLYTIILTQDGEHIAPYNQKNLMQGDDFSAKDKQENHDNVNKIHVKEAAKKMVNTKYSQNILPPEELTNHQSSIINNPPASQVKASCGLIVIVNFWRYIYIITKQKYLGKQKSWTPYFKPFLPVEPMDMALLTATSQERKYDDTSESNKKENESTCS